MTVHLEMLNCICHTLAQSTTCVLLEILSKTVFVISTVDSAENLSIICISLIVD